MSCGADQPSFKLSTSASGEGAARLGGGEWQPGDQLPSIAELAGFYQVSPGVIQRVHRRLAADGLIRVRENWGTFKA
jgi:DNA-binding transcriptional regulator YhcF (GntR family)